MLSERSWVPIRTPHEVLQDSLERFWNSVDKFLTNFLPCVVQVVFTSIIGRHCCHRAISAELISLVSSGLSLTCTVNLFPIMMTFLFDKTLTSEISVRRKLCLMPHQTLHRFEDLLLFVCLANRYWIRLMASKSVDKLGERQAISNSRSALHVLLTLFLQSPSSSLVLVFHCIGHFEPHD